MTERKKSSQTSKTAHVMNLLGKTRAPEEGAGRDTATEGTPPPILSMDTQDVALSADIQKALEGALEEGAAAEPKPPAAPDPAPGAEDQADAPQPADPPKPEAHEAPEAAPPTASEADGAPDSPVEMAYVNVMQALVEERVRRYMEMFGICTCSRCKADVTALALCNLPPKYVVMGRGEMIPRITLYEQQYSAAITAAIVRSCKVVMECPHHDR